MWNFSRQREGSEPALLLEVTPGSRTAPGEPSPAERGEEAELTAVMRLCGSGLTPMYGPSDRADTPFLRGDAEIFKILAEASLSTLRLCQMNYCKYEWQVIWPYITR